MDNEIKIVIDFKGTLDRNKKKYDFISKNEEYYPSHEQYKAYQNYFKHKEESDLLFDLTSSFIKGAFDAVQYAFNKKANAISEKEIDRLVKEWVKSNPNMTWTD